ncbi:serine hydrolase domain-containing protein [Paenibacillus sp. FSL H8-0048]|uniref:serine hydrolase domain-containing protein n=1 Tax=Paenibacillus sp. FSL H8-0048 TaxID=2954508 RepID=UPI0030FBD3DA
MKAANKEALKESIAVLMKKNKIPGVALALWHNGKRVHLEGYGFTDHQRRMATGVNSVFQLGSISKTLTAWGVMKLVEEKILDLEAPVDTYLHKWKLPSSSFDHSKITLQSLLSHTGGMNISGYLGYPEVQVNTDLLRTRTFERENGLKVIYEPQQGFKYSGGGYSLVQHVIEEVTGMKFDNYMKKNVFEPLGMQESTFLITERVEPRISQAFGAYGFVMPKRYYAEHAAAGMYSSINDLSRFLGAHMKDTDTSGFLSPESQTKLRTRIFRKVNYGLGYHIVTFPQNRKMLFHHGTNIGFNSSFAVFPEQGAGIALLTNSVNGSHIINRLLHEWVLDIVGENINSYPQGIKMKEQSKIRNAIQILCYDRKGLHLTR